MQLQPQYPNLQQMYGDNSLFTTMYGQDQFNQAQAAAQQNLSQAQQDQNFQAQKLPGELALTNSQAANFNASAGESNARIPGIQAASNTAVRNDQADASIDPSVRRQAALAHIAANTSTDDLTAMENSIKQKMADPSASPSEKQAAASAWQATSTIRQMKMQEQLRSDAQARAASISANAGIQEEKTRSESNERIANIHYGADAMVRKGMTGNPDQQSGALMLQANLLEDQASQAQDEPTRQRLLAGAQKARQFARMMMQQSITEKGAAAGVANQPKIYLDAQGIPTMGGSGASPMPTPPPMPGDPTTPAAPTTSRPPPTAGDVIPYTDPKTGVQKFFRFTGGDISNHSNYQEIK